jgi:DNA-binding Lrp family transcriptional regulator
MKWIYGSKEEEVEPLVKRQNPDLNILREVVKNGARRPQHRIAELMGPTESTVG